MKIEEKQSNVLSQQILVKVENDMQLLSEYKNIYKIYAKYEDNNLIGYKLEINPDGWYDEDTRGGYDTVETIASTLELDKMQFETEFSKAVIDGEYTYSDNGYEISFYYDISSDGELNEATIDFDKTSE